MGWYDSTNAILGIKSAEQQRKNDRWQKLMDLANAGVDVWNIVSGRKYQTKERIAGQEFQTGERLGSEVFTGGQNALNRTYGTSERLGAEAHDIAMSSTTHGYAKEEFDWQAEFDANEAAKDRTWREGQNALDREMQKRIAELDRLSRVQDRADAKKQFLADWTQRAYNLAISIPEFLDANGMLDPTKREALRKFLYTQVEKLPPEYLSEDEIAWAKASFDGFVNALGASGSAAGGNGAGSGAGSGTTVTNDLSLSELISGVKDTISKLSELNLPTGIRKELENLEIQFIPIENPAAAMDESLLTDPSTLAREILTKLTTLYNIYRQVGKNTMSVREAKEWTK